MPTLKCLACGHDNNVVDERCASCRAPLNLKLCGACEAINAADAERCHGCGLTWRLSGDLAESARTKRSTALWTVPILVAASLTYYFFVASEASPPSSAVRAPVAANAAPADGPAAPKGEPAR
jgi:hypothetical protein